MPKSTQPIGPPPKYFLRTEASCWRELCAMLPPSVLSNSDRWIDEIASRLMAKFRDRDQVTTAAELSRLANALSLVGATPADRSRITTSGNDTPANPFAEFMQ